MFHLEAILFDRPCVAGAVLQTALSFTIVLSVGAAIKKLRLISAAIDGLRFLAALI